MIVTLILLLCACVVVAGVKSVKPTMQLKGMDGTANRQFDTLLQLQVILNNNLVVVNVFLIMLGTGWGLFQSIAVSLVWLMIANVVASFDIIERQASALLHRHRKLFLRCTDALQPALDVLGSSRFFTLKSSYQKYASRDELINNLQRNKDLLDASEWLKVRAVLGLQVPHSKSASAGVRRR